MTQPGSRAGLWVSTWTKSEHFGKCQGRGAQGYQAGAGCCLRPTPFRPLLWESCCHRPSRQVTETAEPSLLSCAEHWQGRHAAVAAGSECWGGHGVCGRRPLLLAVTRPAATPAPRSHTHVRVGLGTPWPLIPTEPHPALAIPRKWTGCDAARFWLLPTEGVLLTFF